MALVSVVALGTGFDAPATDLIALVRPTRSKVLYYQMACRGSRRSPCTVKQDCVLLDFGGSTLKLGRIEWIDWKSPPKRRSKEDRPAVWSCKECGEYNPLTSRTCEGCGYERPTPKAASLEETLSGTDLAVGLKDQERLARVDRATATIFQISTGTHLKIIMHLDGHDEPANDTLWFGWRQKWQRQKAEEKWTEYGGSLPIPRNADEAMGRIAELKKPMMVFGTPREAHGITYWNIRRTYWRDISQI